MLELWGRKNAYNVLKVLWALAELGIDFRHYPVGSSPGELDTPEFLALNPHARIPVIRDECGPLWESNSIVRYLAASHGRDSLWQANAAERARAEAWMDWELCKLQPDFIELFWSCYRTPEVQRDKAVIEAAASRLRAHFLLLDQQLQLQPFLGGERLSVGDIACGVCLYRYFEMDFEVERPEFVMQWYRRLAQREAYRETIMQGFDELYGRTEF
jgi:glutathione S-transferase